MSEVQLEIVADGIKHFVRIEHGCYRLRVSTEEGLVDIFLPAIPLLTQGCIECEDTGVVEEQRAGWEYSQAVPCPSCNGTGRRE